MDRSIFLTSDGSHTITVAELQATYHSHFGALQESVHVFIQSGLLYIIDRMEKNTPLYLFEMGFGTGLNAFLTALEAEKQNRLVHYTTVELYPLTEEETRLLNYTALLGHPYLFQTLHSSKWNEPVAITSYFNLYKQQISLVELSAPQSFHLIYFDAFAPAVQPELWTLQVFEKLYKMTAPGGVLVTYCAKGEVRRNLKAAGFEVEKLAGPPGKREIVKAIRRSANSN